MKVSFFCIDDWNRPTFKTAGGQIYGSLDILFPYGESESEVLKKVGPEDLLFFGRNIDDDPMGSLPICELEIVRSV